MFAMLHMLNIGKNTKDHYGVIVFYDDINLRELLKISKFKINVFCSYFKLDYSLLLKYLLIL